MQQNNAKLAGVFDAVIIGSGYGGSVSAYRLAKSGLSVAVLETGYAHRAPNILQGPDSQWQPEKDRFGPHTVTKLNAKVRAWHGTAVGGGSIVNAAVMIRKDNFENWPGDITRQHLDPYYDVAERMLGASVYPLRQASSPYAATTKTRFILQAAEKLGVPAVMPPVAITYRAQGEAIGTVKRNQHGAEQQGCRQCGQCSLPGCNYQAKNSLDFNYLYAAEHQYGARVLPGCKVKTIEPMADGRYRITAMDPRTGLISVYEAKIVVVAAGSLGSSELLLRNKLLHKTLPQLSPALGFQYTTNGTFIGFAVRSKTDLDPAGGPEITAGLDLSGPDGKSQGHLIFDGSFSGFSYETFYITGRLVGLRNWAIKLVSKGFKLAEKIKLVQPKTTLPLLVIGRDNAVGKFSLDQDGRLQTDLNPADNASFYERANRHMRSLTRAMGTRFLPFALWSARGKIDVPHNLGGVPMGSSSESGVVDDKGRVYGYDNLLVLDGSIIPATMGANPALTIAALAERSMEAVVAQWREQGFIRACPADVAAPPPAEDLTHWFGSIHESVAAYGARPLFAPDQAVERPTRALWVPGILARHMGNHSKAILARMRRLGLDVVPVAVDTDIATAENIVLIKNHIRELKPGQGILAGHSRGGNMALDAYRQLSAEDKAKIARIILIQAPVNGAPLADFLMATGLRRKVVAAATRLIFGNNMVDTFLELSVHGRAIAQRALPPLTAEDLAKIYTMRAVIAKGESPSFGLLRSINEHYGQQSDGITPYALSEIPGTRDVTLTAYDHENCVIQEPTLLKRLTLYRPNKRYEAGDVIESLLRLAFVQP